MIDAFYEGFDWDEGNVEKCRSHGVSIEEIENALVSKALMIVRDGKHSKIERRYVAIGRTGKGRDLFVGFTFRIVAGRKLLRPITARYMHRKEVERYEQTHTPI